MAERLPSFIVAAQDRLTGWCGSSFWNVTLTWNSNLVDVTECFQRSILVWVPCVFLWVALPFYLVYLFGGRRDCGKCSALNVTKCVLCLILAASAAVEVVYYEVWIFPMPKLFVVSAVLVAVTMVTAAALTILYKRRGLMTSGVLWLYWLLWLLSSSVMAYFKVKDAVLALRIDGSLITFSTTVVLFTVIFSQFILACFSDASRDEKGALERKCPEHLSSFTSYLTFHWLCPLMRLAHKQHLEESDLYGPPPRDQLANHGPQFEKAWQKAIDDWRKRKERIVEACADKKTGAVRDVDPVDTNERTPLLLSIKEKDSHRYGKARKQEEVGLSLAAVLSSCYRKLVLAAFFWKFLHDLLKFADPQLQSLLIQYIAAEERQAWTGYFIALGFVGTQLLQAVLSQQSWHLSSTVGLQIKAALTAAIQKKTLTMAIDGRKAFPPQEIFNLLNVDIPRIQEAVKYLWILWSAPLLTGLAMWQLYEIIGVSTFAGLAFVAICTPVAAAVAAAQRKLQLKRSVLKSERNRLTSEALGEIKVLKLFTWESSFEENISMLRTAEMAVQRKIWGVRAAQIGLWTLSSVAVAVVMFSLYTFLSKGLLLRPEVAFVALSLLNIIRGPLNLLPVIVPYFIGAKTSIKRLTMFFQLPDIDERSIQHDLSACSVSIQSGAFSWLSGAPPVLKNVNLDVAENSLTAIVGKPGHGKTSLLCACIGDMYKVSGCVNINGSVAYVGQTAWIHNATIRDNILFGKDYSELFYKHVLDACQLQPQLLGLENGDMTVIGEMGSGLTACQKQLISLARAVYADADIYLIDNIFAPIATDISQRLYDRVIGKKGLLKDKTRVIVAQGVHWLADVDSIAVLSDGEVAELGSYSKLASHDGPFTQYLKAYFLSDENTTTNNEVMELQAVMLQNLVTVLGQQSTQAIKPRNTVTDNARLAAPIRDNEASYSSYVLAKGATAESDVVCQGWRWTSQNAKDVELDTCHASTSKETWTSCCLYFREMGWWLTVGCLVLLLLHFGAAAFADVWLCAWTDDVILQSHSASAEDKSDRLRLFIYIYACLGAAQVAFVVAFSCLFAIGLIRASRNLHATLLHSVMRATLVCIEKTPFSVILKRFSKDIDTLDDVLSFLTFQTLQNILFFLSTMAVITYCVPVCLSLLLPVGIFVCLTQALYVPTVTQIRRLETGAKQCIDAHFTELVSGTSVVRAYGNESWFNSILSGKIEKHMATNYLNAVACRWLALRLEIVSAFVVSGTAALAVLSQQFGLRVNASLAGLAITYALNVAASLQFIVRNNADMKDHIVSVNKIKECAEMPREADNYMGQATDARIRRSDASKEGNIHPRSGSNLAANWPQQGVVELRRYSARHLSMEPALDFKDVTAFIKRGEKVGVIHRSGSGTTTLVLPIFRLVEPVSGSIVIDGIDISKLNVYHLRKRLTVIAQDPIMFSGSLRYNLDPCAEFSDDLIWSALERARLKKLVLSLPAQLQYQYVNGAQSLSISQRRLLGVARALLRKTKVVFVLDDPPARDQATDAMVRKIVQREFADCTVITVTQRLHLIMSCDRILIMDEGGVVEFDAPAVLQKKTSGAFYDMSCGGM